MSPKAVLSLAVVALISSGLAFWAVASREDALSSSGIAVALAPELLKDMGHVAQVTVSREGSVITLQRQPDGWVVAERGGYPADAGKIAALARSIASANLIEPKTDQPDRLRRLGLGDPDQQASKSARIVIRDANGRKLVAIVIGKERYGLFGPGRSGSYLRRDGENQAWLADRRIEVPGELVEWLPRRIVDIPDSRIARVGLKGPDGEEVVIGPRPSADSELVLESVPEGRQADLDKIERLAGSLSGLTLQDVRAASELPLPADAPTARFETLDGLIVTVRLVTRGEGEAQEYWAALEPSAGQPMPAVLPNEGTKPLAEQVAELRRNLDGWVFKLPRYTAERMLWAKDDLTKPAGKTS